jgi:predicted aldo/keto reductase-like oxidoreductase
VEEVRSTYASRALVPCTTCGYCAPCPAGVAIPETFATYNTGAMFNQWPGAAASYAMFLTGPGHDASLCASCGACEAKCPQQIPIMDKLREAHRALSPA